MGEAGVSPGNQSGANFVFPVKPVPGGRPLELGIFVIIHGMLFSVAMVLCILISVLM